MDSELGESIIQNIKGVSIVIQRCLRDLLHQLPSTEVSIKVLHFVFRFVEANSVSLSI